MKVDKVTLAKDILKLVGGSENVQGVTHCATRLRFRVSQSDKVKKVNWSNIQTF